MVPWRPSELPVHLPVIAPLVDGLRRRIDYLRVSLTDRCNFRCTYCMPEQGMVFHRRAELLTFEEIERVVRVFAGLGVERVRLTGGEPTVRHGVLDLVARLAEVPGPGGEPLRLVMTSNGFLLGELAGPLRRAGLREVNISIDTLDAQIFRQLTRRDEIGAVISGIDAALEAGLKVKLNAVALRGVNDGELADLCRFAWDRGVLPRFIEHMPMSGGQLFDREQRIDAAEIRQRVSEATGTSLRQVSPEGVHGPSRYWELDDGSGRRFGIISAMSEHFCDTCNRLRLTATGDLHACLAYDDALSLRDVVRKGGTDADLRAAIHAAVAGKRVGHQFQSTGVGAPGKHMIAIGG